MHTQTPTTDERAGMAWWNALTEPQRADWLQKAGSAVPADAWRTFKRYQEKYSYEVNPRPVEAGGGWRLRLIEDGQEVGGGVFPLISGIEDDQEADKAAYDDATNEGEKWFSSRP